MTRMIFVNIPVKDLQRSITFFTELGFSFNQQFTDENAACMILSDQACVMLLTEPRFRDFTKKEVVDATAATEAILAISADSREEVDSLVNKAIASGGKPSNDPMDHAFMYGWSFQDLDGHMWEVLWMDPNAGQA